MVRERGGGEGEGREGKLVKLSNIEVKSSPLLQVSPSLPPWNFTRTFFSRYLPSSELRSVSLRRFSGGGAWGQENSSKNNYGTHLATSHS